MSKPICFLDVESTGVQHYHELWEIALVKVSDIGTAEEKVEKFSSLVKPQNFVQADPFALSIGKFSERYDPSAAKPWAHMDAWNMLNGCTLAGITVSFDARMVGDWFLRNDLPPFPWHYRLLDVSTYAAGIAAASGLLPPGETPNSDKIFKMFNIEIPEKDRHTAMGDAYGTFLLYKAALQHARKLSSR